MAIVMNGWNGYMREEMNFPSILSLLVRYFTCFVARCADHIASNYREAQ